MAFVVPSTSQGEHSNRNRHEIQSLFDPQVEGIAKKIIEELDWLRDNGHPQQVVSSCDAQTKPKRTLLTQIATHDPLRRPR